MIKKNSDVVNEFEYKIQYNIITFFFNKFVIHQQFTCILDYFYPAGFVRAKNWKQYLHGTTGLIKTRNSWSYFLTSKKKIYKINVLVWFCPSLTVTCQHIQYIFCLTGYTYLFYRSATLSLWVEAIISAGGHRGRENRPDIQ